MIKEVKKRFIFIISALNEVISTLAHTEQNAGGQIAYEKYVNKFMQMHIIVNAVNNSSPARNKNL